MKLLRTYVLSVLCVQFCNAMTDAWSVNVNDHTAVQRTYKQGESIDMRIILRSGLAPLDLTGATARFYWFTNATQNVWWTNSVTISAPKAGLVESTWTPAMDTGAPMYYYWIGVWQAGATSPLWRVTGNIRMLTSPGFTPNALPMPVRTLDFAAITVTNAPWLLASDLQAYSTLAALTSSTGSLYTASLASLTAATSSLAQASAASLADYASTNRTVRLYNPTNASEWIDGSGSKWRITSYQGKVFLPSELSSVWPETGGTNDFPFSSGDWEGFVALYTMPDYYFPTHRVLHYLGGSSAFDDLYWVSSSVVGGPEILYPHGDAYEYGIGHLHASVTSRVDTVALLSDIPSTNYIAGFALPIPGTNVVYQLSVDSNRVLTVWEVLP